MRESTLRNEGFIERRSLNSERPLPIMGGGIRTLPNPAR